MAFIMARSKPEFLNILQTRLQTHVEPEEKEAIAHFNQHFFGIVPLEELLDRHDSDLLGCTLSFWRFLQEYSGPEEKIRVFNADTQQHGWESTHSVVEILNLDSPFLVDSVRMELKRQGHQIHTLQNSVIRVERGPGGKLKTIHDDASTGAGIRAESVMFIEIDRCATPAALREVQAGLIETLAHVRAAVTDFPAMREQMSEVVAKLEHNGQPFFDADERTETVDFLNWLLDDHFTFLGYERFHINERLAEGRLGMETDKSLGVPAYDPLDDMTEGLPEDVLGYLQEPLLLSFAKRRASAACTVRPIPTMCRFAKWTTAAGCSPNTASRGFIPPACTAITSIASRICGARWRRSRAK